MGLLTDVIIFPRDQNTDGLLLGVGGDGRGWEGCTKADAVMITITKSWPTVGSLGLGVRGVCSRGCRHKQVQYIQFHGEGVDRLMSVAVDMVFLTLQRFMIGKSRRMSSGSNLAKAISR